MEMASSTPLNSNKLSLDLGKIFLLHRLFPKRTDLQALMQFYDVDGDGNITYEEFVMGLRDDLSER